MKLMFFKRQLGNATATRISRGFTMIELIISIGIFTLLSAVTLTKYNTFNNNAEFTNATESIVLALRQAQVYGVAAKSSLDGSGTAIVCGVSAFDCVYGVHFQESLPSQVSIFIDENRNYQYNGPIGGSPGEKIVEVISWKSPIKIFDVQCQGGNCSGGNMDVTFRRPNPDGFITDVSPCDAVSVSGDCFSGSSVILPESYKEGVIILTNEERFSTTTISSTGQISLK